MKDLLVFEGGEIKALGDGKIGGHLVLYGSPDQLDFEGDFFTAETDFDLTEGKDTAIYYSHGLDKNLKQTKLGRGTLKADDLGIWIEAQLELRDQYEEFVYGMVEAGKLGWSSGTAPHLMAREEAEKGFHITAWPLGVDASLTPMPADPRNKAITLKSWAGMQSAEDAMAQEGVSAEAEQDEKSKRKQAATAALLLSGAVKHLEV